MPKRRRTSRVLKVRLRKRLRRRARRPRVMRGTMLGQRLGFPDKCKFKHVYVETFPLNVTSSVLQHMYFVTNGMYDLNHSGGGHQPMYFDQMAALYNHYHVIGSKIEWEIVPQLLTAQAPGQFCAWINDDTSITNTTIETIAETTGAKIKLMQGGLNPDRLKFVSKWSAKKRFGNVMANDQLTGNVAANPAEKSYFVLSFNSLAAASDCNIYVKAKITYVAIWNELKDIAAS